MGQIKNIKLHIVTDIKVETHNISIMTASQDINELKNDLQELESVLGMVNRSNVRMIIADAISTLRTKVEEVSKKSLNQAAQQQQKSVPPKQNLYAVKISNYGWDESQKFVKVYVSLPNIDKLTQEQIACDFTGQSFKCTVNNHNGKNHTLELPTCWKHCSSKFYMSTEECKYYYISKKGKG